MEGRSFTVEQAASIMGCTPRTVHNLLAEGWLKSPDGRPKRGESAKVSEKSLFQVMIVDRLSHLPDRALKRLRTGRKIFGSFRGKVSQANRSFTYEGTGKVDGALSPVNETPIPLASSAQEKSSTGLRAPPTCLHHDFAEQHQFSFGMCAQQLAPDDPAMQDDLVQEMSLAVLEYEKPASFDFLFELATNRAKDYLKYEATRGMLSLEQARHVSDTYAEQIASLNAFIEELIERGVPIKWIEEVTGTKLDAA